MRLEELKGKVCLIFCEGRSLLLYIDLIEEIMNFGNIGLEEGEEEFSNSILDYQNSEEMISFSRSTGHENKSAPPEIIFYIETDTLEEAYCYGMDLIEYVMAKKKNHQNPQKDANLSYYLFIKKELPRSEMLRQFDYINGEITKEKLEIRYMRNATTIFISGRLDFKSRINTHLLDLPYFNDTVDIRTYQ